MLHTFLYMLIGLAVLGLAAYLLEQIPMDATVAKVFHVVVIVAMCLYLIYFVVVFLIPLIPDLPSPRRT